MSATLHERRLAAQLLSGQPAATAEDVVRRLLAVQGQDPRGARLAVRSRSTGVRSDDVDAGLTERRSLVISWLNRGTLHLVTAEDYWWLHPLTAPHLVTGNARRLREEGVSEAQADKGVEVVTAAVAEGPRTRGELRELLDAAGVPTARQALVHVLVAATLRGDLVRGPVHGREHAFVSARHWLGPPPPELDREQALARLARRYLLGHGPATAADLARWSGIPLGQARAGIRALGDEVTAMGDPPDLVDLADRGPVPKPPAPRLLGAFDPVLLGWVSRADVVGAHQELVTVNGLFRPFALVKGRAVATWGLDGGTVTIRPLEPLGPAVRRALEADAAEVLDFLGYPRRPPVIAG